MAQHSVLTGCCWTSIVILCSLSLSVSRLSKPAGSFIHSLYKQAQLSWSTRTAIYHASESDWKFRHWSDLKFLGWCSGWGDLLSVTVSNHTEEVGMLEAEILLSCTCVWFWSNHIGVCVCICVCVVVQSVNHIWQLTSTKRQDWTSGQSWSRTSSGITTVCRYHHSQFSCLDCPIMNYRFMFLISDSDQRFYYVVILLLLAVSHFAKVFTIHTVFEERRERFQLC